MKKNGVVIVLLLVVITLQISWIVYVQVQKAKAKALLKEQGVGNLASVLATLPGGSL